VFLRSGCLLPCLSGFFTARRLPRLSRAHARRHLVEKLNKKSKANNVKPFMVKNHLWVFINAQIENPAFDSQVRVWALCTVFVLATK
jgi:hypothetical protein